MSGLLPFNAAKRIFVSVLIQSIHYTFAAEDGKRASEMLAELRDLSMQEPGVLSFLVARSIDKPNVFALWEEYRDEAAFKAHADTEHFARLVVNGTRRIATARVGETVVPLP